MHSNADLILDDSAQERGVDVPARRRSWLFWPVKGFILIAALLTALLLNALAFFS